MKTERDRLIEQFARGELSEANVEMALDDIEASAEQRGYRRGVEASKDAVSARVAGHAASAQHAAAMHFTATWREHKGRAMECEQIAEVLRVLLATPAPVEPKPSAASEDYEPTPEELARLCEGEDTALANAAEADAQRMREALERIVRIGHAEWETRLGDNADDVGPPDVCALCSMGLGPTEHDADCVVGIATLALASPPQAATGVSVAVRAKPSANQCEHGSLARSCVVCELTASRDLLAEALRRIAEPENHGEDRPRFIARAALAKLDALSRATSTTEETKP